LPEHGVDISPLDEHWSTVARADCYEIPMKSDVIERFESGRWFEGHEAGGAGRVPA
jgi:hypothetical protein